MRGQQQEELDTQSNKHTWYAIFRPVYEQWQYGCDHVTQTTKNRMEQHIQI